MAVFAVLWGCVLMAAVRTDAAANLVEQRPRWVLVPRMQAKTLLCTLKDTVYPWMSWYQQDLQGQLELLATLRSSGDKKVITLPGAGYKVKRVSNTELELHVENVTQSRTLYCTCSIDTVRHPLRGADKNHAWLPAMTSSSSSARQPPNLPPPSQPSLWALHKE